MQSIRSIGILSCAKVMGATYGAMGLLFCPLFVIAALAGALSGVSGNHTNAALTVVGGLGAAILMPILYGTMGFVFGAFGAWVYNMVAGKFGGIQIELQDVTFPGNPANRLGLV